MALLNALLLGNFLENEQETDIVGEDDDLPVLCLLGQSPCDPPSPLGVKRGDRIVEHDARRIVGCAELGKERGDGEAALVPFADNLRQVDAGSTLEDKLAS